ncbi:DUF3644 domain-containing protein [Streptomyces sp. NPDC050256]|uniref:DUF3644 domain-containing protein n=1 Tax=Streptomyces sp. NPDC050256 TaxID=3365607 RepID=UPI0037A80E9E
MVLEARRHALRALDEWNSSAGNYVDFLTHLHKAWHYLLHARFHRDGISYHYKDAKTGKYLKVDGEPKAWDLEKCLTMHFGSSGPAFHNASLFVALRNKVEHRYEHAMAEAPSDRIRANFVNFENELIEIFGAKYSLGTHLRMPISLQPLTRSQFEELADSGNDLPRKTRDFIARFERDLGPTVLEDQAYSCRVKLTPVVQNRAAADISLKFINQSGLGADIQGNSTANDRIGTVLIKPNRVEVADKGKYRPSKVVQLVLQQLPFDFSVHEHTVMWQEHKIRPRANDGDPAATTARFCLYSPAVEQYLYTDAWVTFIVSTIGTVDSYKSFFGREPRPKLDAPPTAAPPQT